MPQCKTLELSGNQNTSKGISAIVNALICRSDCRIETLQVSNAAKLDWATQQRLERYLSTHFDSPLQKFRGDTPCKSFSLFAGPSLAASSTFYLDQIPLSQSPLLRTSEGPRRNIQKHLPGLFLTPTTSRCLWSPTMLKTSASTKYSIQQCFNCHTGTFLGSLDDRW